MVALSPRLDYENHLVRCRALRRVPRVSAMGFTLDEADAGEEFRTFFWVAVELGKQGLVELLEETLSPDEWTQVHFKERLNPAGPPNPLPERFYAKAYQSIKWSKEIAPTPNLNRVQARYRDILEARINRITRIAVSEADSPTRVLQREETTLYAEVKKAVSRWRHTMREVVDQ